MNDISTLEPEKYLATTDAELFLIILVSIEGHFLYAGGTFSNIEHAGFNGAIVHERRHLVKQYWEAARFANSDFGNYPMRTEKVRGALEIIPIPRLVNYDNV